MNGWTFDVISETSCTLKGQKEGWFDAIWPVPDHRGYYFLPLVASNRSQPSSIILSNLQGFRRFSGTWPGRNSTTKDGSFLLHKWDISLAILRIANCYFEGVHGGQGRKIFYGSSVKIKCTSYESTERFFCFSFLFYYSLSPPFSSALRSFLWISTGKSEGDKILGEDFPPPAEFFNERCAWYWIFFATFSRVAWIFVSIS